MVALSEVDNAVSVRASPRDPGIKPDALILIVSTRRIAVATSVFPLGLAATAPID
jgi:hypothetical protein